MKTPSHSSLPLLIILIPNKTGMLIIWKDMKMTGFIPMSEEMLTIPKFLPVNIYSGPRDQIATDTGMKKGWQPGYPFSLPHGKPGGRIAYMDWCWY